MLPRTQPDAARSATRRGWFARLAEVQLAFPWRVLLVSALLTAVTLALALRLKLHAGFEYLLPQDRPSVRELHRVARLTAGVSTLFVVLHADGGTPEEARAALRHAGDDLTGRLGALGPPWVGSVEDGVQTAYRFLSARAGLYGDLAELNRLRDDLDARFVYEVG